LHSLESRSFVVPKVFVSIVHEVQYSQSFGRTSYKATCRLPRSNETNKVVQPMVYLSSCMVQILE
jgi:hypothetical protein